MLLVVGWPRGLSLRRVFLNILPFEVTVRTVAIVERTDLERAIGRRSEGIASQSIGTARRTIIETHVDAFFRA